MKVGKKILEVIGGYLYILCTSSRFDKSLDEG